MLRQLWIAVRLCLVTLLLTGVLYPLVVTGVAQTLFRSKADGSLVRVDGRVVGSTLIGQSFSRPEYFHPRPSAAGDGYDATASGGSNLGPTSEKLRSTVEKRAEAYRRENGLAEDEPVPVDAITASGSGLDPHITLANADLQVQRVAKARSMTEDQVRDLVAMQVEGRDLGMFGEPRVNVLALNLSLDESGAVRQGETAPAADGPSWSARWFEALRSSKGLIARGIVATGRGRNGNRA